MSQQLIDAPNVGLDVPDDVPPGHLLGRVINHERAEATYGRRLVGNIARHYNIGDELGYAAYVALRSAGLEPGQARRMYNQAVEHGIQTVREAPDELRELFSGLETPPDWVDWDQLHRGAVAYWRPGKLVVMAIAYAAIGAGFRTYGGTRELVMSRRIIDRDQTGRRLIESLRWAAEASTPGGMRRFAPGFRLTMKVRWIHAAVRYHCSRDETWDWQDWGVSVDGVSSVYTMGTLFTEGVVSALERIGIVYSRQEKEDIAALWRYVGYVMGVPEELNFTSWNDLKRKSGALMMMEHPADDGCRLLMRTLIDFMCEERIEGYQLLPAFLDDRLGVEGKKELTYGLMRGWAGDDLCEQLDVPDSRLRVLVPIARPLVRTAMGYQRRVRRQDDEEAAWNALADFGVALRLADGDPEVAIAEDVVDRFKQFGHRRHEILGH